MKLTRKRLLKIIKEEVEALDMPEMESDAPEAEPGSPNALEDFVSVLLDNGLSPAAVHDAVQGSEHDASSEEVDAAIRASRGSVGLDEA